MREIELRHFSEGEIMRQIKLNKDDSFKFIVHLGELKVQKTYREFLFVMHTINKGEKYRGTEKRVVSQFCDKFNLNYHFKQNLIDEFKWEDTYDVYAEICIPHSSVSKMIADEEARITQETENFQNRELIRLRKEAVDYLDRIRQSHIMKKITEDLYDELPKMVEDAFKRNSKYFLFSIKVHQHELSTLKTYRYRDYNHSNLENINQISAVYLILIDLIINIIKNSKHYKGIHWRNDEYSGYVFHITVEENKDYFNWGSSSSSTN